MRTLLAILLGVGCSRASPTEPSPALAGAEAPQVKPAPSQEARSEVAEWFQIALTWPKATEQPLASAHLGTPHMADIYVNPEALGTYLALVRDTQFPVATWFIERLRETETGRQGPVLALERTAERWRFWVFDSQGHVDPGASPEFCAACHAGAVAPPVFGPARKLSESAAPAAPRRE